MARQSPYVLKALGMMFLVAAMVCAVGAAVLANRARPAFLAQTLLKLNSPADNARIAEAFRQAQAQFPERMHRPLTGRVSLDPGPALDFYRVTALAESPLASAETANTLTRLLHESLRGASEVSPMMLLETAQPPAAPTRTHVKGILKTGLVLGVAFGAIGALMLTLAARRRDRQEQKLD